MRYSLNCQLWKRLLVVALLTFSTFAIVNGVSPSLSAEETTFGCLDDQKESIVVVKHDRLSGDEVRGICTDKGYDRPSPKYYYYDPGLFGGYQAYSTATDEPVQGDAE